MSDKLLDYTIINGYYFIPLLGGIGFIFNSVCLLVIFSANFKNREKFNYIIVELAIEMLGCIYFIVFQNYLMCSWDSKILPNNPCVDAGSFA